MFSQKTTNNHLDNNILKQKKGPEGPYKINAISN